MALLSGIHPVVEALRAGNPLERIVIAQGAGGPRLQEIIDLARQAKIPVRFEPRSSLDRLAGSPAHQGVVGLGAARKYADLDSVADSEMLVVLDGVEDPHNLGAIVAPRGCGGDRPGAARGGRRGQWRRPRRAPRAFTRGRVTSINRALEDRKRGMWIYGLDERGTETTTGSTSAEKRPVLGGEGRIARAGPQTCDVLVRIRWPERSLAERVGGHGVVLFFRVERRRSEREEAKRRSICAPAGKQDADRPGCGSAGRSRSISCSIQCAASGRLLDRRYFALSAEDFARFASMLDKPPKDNPKLRRLRKKTSVER